LCSYHHRLVHEGGFCVERVGKRGVRFRRPDGCLIPETSPPRRAGGPGLERQHRAQGVAISAETCKPRSLGDPLDYGIAVEGLCMSTERALKRTHARERPHDFREERPRDFREERPRDFREERPRDFRRGPHEFPNRTTNFPKM
jgi:hypothetical protein